MFVSSEVGGLVNLDHVFSVDRIFMMNEKKYVIVFQNPFGQVFKTWKYVDEKERDAAYAKVKKALGDKLVKI